MGAEMRGISLASRAKCQLSELQQAHPQAGGRQAASPTALEAKERSQVHASPSWVPTGSAIGGFPSVLTSGMRGMCVSVYVDAHVCVRVGVHAHVCTCLWKLKVNSIC